MILYLCLYRGNQNDVDLSESNVEVYEVSLSIIKCAVN